MTIRRLVSGETTDPRISTLKLIADYFNVTIDSLIGDNIPNANALISKNTPKFIPILDWTAASQMRSIKDLDFASWKKWQPVTLPSHLIISNYAFALESRPSMRPRFPIGTIFIIEPAITSSDGDMVLIRVKNSSELTLRELIIDPPEWQLHPLVPGSNILYYESHKYDLAGVVLLTLLYNQRVID